MAGRLAGVYSGTPGMPPLWPRTKAPSVYRHSGFARYILFKFPEGLIPHGLS